ncbi:hypothetical protein CPB83DRAFT_888745 [Crepidotus variabilis]|uniref:Uncharacterized protein n=1 Tax=Crepidotus variabilis TaxID=179855 RepID=A0A9P6ETK6_9AGAR|nr:hypothetical protein CPB83DRAFT_888745 [Crepidotus variabilis]
MRSLLNIGTVFLILHLSLLTWSASSSNSTHTPFASSLASIVSIFPSSHSRPLSGSHRASLTAAQALQPSHSSRPRHHGVNKEQHRTQQSLITALAVIGGLAAFIFFIAILRCSIKFKKAPKRDRIAEIVQRHNLDCEMGILERNTLGIRRFSPQEPAPPYTPRPPSYSQANSSSSAPSDTLDNDQPTRSPTIPTAVAIAPTSSIP